MKIILAILLGIFTMHTYAEIPNYNLTVTITNIKKIKGNVNLGIFVNQNSFLIPGKAYKTLSKKVVGNNLIFILNDLPKGSYAISLFHDVNADNICNLNFLGIPTEPYAFSNNFRPKLSKPNFKDCELLLEKDQSINIKLID